MRRVQLEQLVEAQAVAEEGLASPGKVHIYTSFLLFANRLSTSECVGVSFSIRSHTYA